MLETRIHVTCCVNFFEKRVKKIAVNSYTRRTYGKSLSNFMKKE